MKVFVTGASGFVGRNLIAALLESGHGVAAWTRRAEADLGVRDARLERRSGDLGDPAQSSVENLAAALSGCRAAVHLAARTSEGSSTDSLSNAVNIEGTARLLEAAQRSGVRRFVYVSTQSAKISSPSRYGATKKMGEELAAGSGLDAVILRPALIYGPGNAGIFKKFVGLVEKFPLLPIPATDVRFQPVFIGDVVAAIQAALLASDLKARVFDVAGPDPVTFPELIRKVAQARGLRRVLLPVPMGLALMGAKALSLILKKPPVTVDNLIGLTESTPVDLVPLKEELGVQPTALEAGLKKTFERKSP